MVSFSSISPNSNSFVVYLEIFLIRFLSLTSGKDKSKIDLNGHISPLHCVCFLIRVSMFNALRALQVLILEYLSDLQPAMCIDAAKTFWFDLSLYMFIYKSSSAACCQLIKVVESAVSNWAFGNSRIFSVLKPTWIFDKFHGFHTMFFHKSHSVFFSKLVGQRPGGIVSAFKNADIV